MISEQASKSKMFEQSSKSIKKSATKSKRDDPASKVHSAKRSLVKEEQADVETASKQR